MGAGTIIEEHLAAGAGYEYVARVRADVRWGAFPAHSSELEDPDVDVPECASACTMRSPQFQNQVSERQKAGTL